MKTIVVIISGLADIGEPQLAGKTPLMLADTPALDALARCGCGGTLRVLPEGVPITRENAILSLLGYDFSYGAPPVALLHELGSRQDMPAGPVRYFVIPKFSGHGILISAHAAVRGIGKMALLKAVDPTSLYDGNGSSLRHMADLALGHIASTEFVALHVESPASMSRRHDAVGKERAIEKIDREVIAPIADYVWNANEQMTMVVVSDCVYSWLRGKPLEGEVPAVVYFNDDPPYDTDRFDEVSLEEGPLNVPLPGDLMKLLISFEPVFPDS